MQAPAFSRYFEIVPALDAATRDAGYVIRHAVYCEDLHFEPPRPDGREHDAYDPRAFQCLLRHRPSGQFVGVTRLVVLPRDAPEALLPFERSCADTLFRGTLDPTHLPRQAIAEVSRLAVVRSFRRRRGETVSPLPISASDFGSAQQPRFPYIPIGLYLGAIAMARALSIHTLFTLTEPRLAQHFARCGVAVVQVGAPIEHRGQRVPSMIEVERVVVGLSGMVLPIWQAIDASVQAAWPGADAVSRALMASLR